MDRIEIITSVERRRKHSAPYRHALAEVEARLTVRGVEVFRRAHRRPFPDERQPQAHDDPGARAVEPSTLRGLDDRPHP
jgi:hypothetical protein